MNAPFNLHGDIQTLTLSVAQHARNLGVSVIRIQASRVKRSASYHLLLRDRRRRDWHIRISDHSRMPATGYEIPHFDLVTNGHRGAQLAMDFVGRVSRDEEPWTVPVMTRTRKGQPRRFRR